MFPKMNFHNIVISHKFIIYTVGVSDDIFEFGYVEKSNKNYVLARNKQRRLSSMRRGINHT